MKTSNKLKEQQVALATTQQGVLLAINSEFEALLNAINELPIIEVGDKEGYDKALELKKEVKKTHVSIEKKRKELKAPILEMGKNLDTFAKSLSEPLKQGENDIKLKVSEYEQEIAREKAVELELKELAEKREQVHQENIEWVQKEMRYIINAMKSCNTLSELKELEVKENNFYMKLGSFDVSNDISEKGRSQVLFAISQVEDFKKMKKQILEIQEETITKVDLQQMSDNISFEEELTIGNEQPMSEVLKEVKVMPTPQFVKSTQLPNGKFEQQLVILKELYDIVACASLLTTDTKFKDRCYKCLEQAENLIKMNSNSL